MYLFKFSVFVFSDIYPGVELLGHRIILFFVFFFFFRKLHAVLYSGYTNLHSFPPTVYKDSLFCTSSPTFVICGLLMMAILTGVI